MYTKDHKNQELDFLSLKYHVFLNVWYSGNTSTKKLGVDSSLRDVPAIQICKIKINKITWARLRLDSLPRDVFAV